MRILVLEDVTVAGVAYHAGNVYEVKDWVAAWLIDTARAAPIPTRPETATRPPPEKAITH